jgi:hypothetical protein
MQVAPAHAERDIHYALVGDGPGHHTDESDERAATGLEATVGSGCILCDDSGFPGQWSFTLAIGASAAHYRLHIETTY